MCGIEFDNLNHAVTEMTDADIESLANACKVVSVAYRNHPWFRMAFQDSIISVLREVDECWSPTHYQTARRIAERVFDIE